MSHNDLVVDLAFGSGEGVESLGVLFDADVDGFDRRGGESEREQVVDETDSSLMVRGSKVLTKPLFRRDRSGTVDGEVVH